jgi:iron complex transport system substrate-binding protein
MESTAYPARIVCLSAESAEICARAGAWDRVVGVTAYADQTGLVPRPRISGFSKANVPQVLALKPDVIFTFSDVQAEIASELIRAGCTVVATNPRSLAEIADSIRLIARVAGTGGEGERIAAEFRHELAAIRVEPASRLRVYFEEWPDPLISGIGWVSELIELAGGNDVFAARKSPAARDRMVTAEEVIAAAPEVILASWCGKPVDIPAIRARNRWEAVPAIQSGRIHALESADLLQPGPRLVRGAREIARLLREAAPGSPANR